MIGTRDGAGGARGRDRQEERSHAFWETQPVMQFRDDPSTAVSSPPALEASSLCTFESHTLMPALRRQEQPEGPIDDARDVSSIRQHPYNLPAG